MAISSRYLTSSESQAVGSQIEMKRCATFGDYIFVDLAGSRKTEAGHPQACGSPSQAVYRCLSLPIGFVEFLERRREKYP